METDNLKPTLRIATLISGYLQDDLDADDRAELLAWLNENPNNLLFLENLLNEKGLENDGRIFSAIDGEPVRQKLKAQLFPAAKKKPVFKLLYPYGIAATLFIVAGVATFFFINKDSSIHQTQTVQDIGPGGNKATLILGNGKTINLSSNKTGVVINTKQLTYNDGSKLTAEMQSEKIEMLTMQTPKGGQYEAFLPDGTHVWMNAESSLKFPSAFRGKERVIEMTGEAYFQVAHNSSMPFKVISHGQKVEVLGTHFNINSYPDEVLIKTTLVEGSIRINSNTILKPGDQASLNQSGDISVEQVDVDKMIAWKNGKFVFDSESIESIMRKLARWYDVEVIYKGDVSDRAFAGSISRSDNISKILDKITLTRAVHFKIEGRRIIVMP